MKIINVALKDNPYKILIGFNTLSSVGFHINKLNIGTDAVIITSPVIQRLYGKTLIKSLKKYGFTVKELIVPDGEKSKSAKVAVDLIEKIAKYDTLKKVFVIAFGGGVIGDLAGFVAATYKRGVPYIQIPTTFLAQIDSSIGGKVAVDLSVGKNLMGAFHQPKMVFSDVAVLKTLPTRQIENGFAEAVKYGIIDDKKLFNYIGKNYSKVFKGDEKVLMHMVSRCSQIKTDVVLADEKETKGIRTILNFGHTVGHAIEAAAGFKQYDHGQAIAIGMRIAADISLQMKMIDAPAVDRINHLLTEIGLPKKAKNLTLTKILTLMAHDKKFISGKNRFVLVSNVGKVKVAEDVSTDIIKSAILKYLE
ncbi:MAG: 3-dehydroquinate synthase [Candidatus Omnitrophica bacterium]|nr:3-dehydroquinate synthase [Candidatus Omnitrophota bacterium]